VRIVAYLRASTEEQHRSGLGLDAQRATIESTCEQRGWQLVSCEQDIASGGTRDRAGLMRALEAIDAGTADAVVVSRLDRLGRSVAHVAVPADFGRRAIGALEAQRVRTSGLKA
jgi:DNA invertase Pin-like site-specific DNA recombinase